MKFLFEKTEHQERFQTFLLNVSLRPKMYAPNGSFAEVVAYVNGFIHGAGYPRTMPNMTSGMFHFVRWLADSKTSSLPNDAGPWHELLLSHLGGDGAKAIRGLGLFRKYLASDETD